ncbi:MAG: helix-turn-helix transcriptional regulator [Hyphomicrobiales bacterium]|nr:helix-turn-helix transcriptional regulator [Hyphomicrobiales bacterium]
MRQYRHPEPNEITLPKVLAALSDPVRLSIVEALSQGGERGWSGFDACVANSTLSHHMKVLRLAGVISNRGDGTRCFVSLRPELEQAFPGLLKSILKYSESAKKGARLSSRGKAGKIGLPGAPSHVKQSS